MRTLKNFMVFFFWMRVVYTACATILTLCLFVSYANEKDIWKDTWPEIIINSIGGGIVGAAWLFVFLGILLMLVAYLAAILFGANLLKPIGLM